MDKIKKKEVESNSDEDPTKLKHIRAIRFLMVVVGNWPGRAIKGLPRRIGWYQCYRLFETTTLTTGQILYLKASFQDLSFSILGNLYITLVLSFLVVGRIIYPLIPKYGDIFNNFFNKFHLIHFKNDENAKEIYKTMDRYSTYLTSFHIVLSMCGAITFSLMPVAVNFYNRRTQPPENITLEFSIRYQLPGFRQENHTFLVAWLNLWFSFVTAVVVTIMDLNLCMMVFQIIGHIIYLKNTLKSFPKPKLSTFRVENPTQPKAVREMLTIEAVSHFDDAENEIIRRKIMECVNHHLFIVSFTDELSNFFGPLLASNYLYHLFTLSILVVECMEGGEAYMRYGPLTAMTLSELTQLSIIFEIVHSESERLRDEAYYIPWECMNVSNQKSVSLLLSRMQTPIEVTAMGMTTVSVRTMGSILKTTISYCAFLSSLNH